ncbi:hypothetical protein MycrhDRAFT_5474 [Mycolicibacterium rhodesiae JS60]|nr:hypothetical protein MycrhDRAFT_5474 [Mycolicibacterium rhodesiae JS60]
MNTVAVHQIHAISHDALARAVPNLRPFDIDHELRQEFAAWTARQRNTYATWQAAWNDWTRATARRPGTVHLSVRCPQCRGRSFAIRHGAVVACRASLGRRRINIHTAALWQPTSERAEDRTHSPR